MMEKRLKLYLNSLVANSGSDLHLKSGSHVRVRVHGALKKMGDEQLTHKQLNQLAQEITSELQYTKLTDERTLDFTYVLDEMSRFRVNFFFQMDGLSAVFRIIPVEIPTLEQLDLPAVIKTFAEIPRGLVLVTGVTGSGKSTTLAALINQINMTSPKHIITLEDPIEFVHRDRKALINQRAVGEDTRNFGDALRAALREDPDIILVGEIRDLETIDLALHAANTGHLVFSTLHTLDAKETINRVIGMFAKEEQNRVRGVLSSVLAGVISQRLAPTISGTRTAVIEAMVRTSRVAEMIAEGRDMEIPDAIEEGKEIYGSQTFDQHLLDLIDEGKITEETALEYATSPSDLKLKLQGIGRGGTKQSRMDDATQLDAFEFKEDEDQNF
jgi:twitching motility protein PilT